MERDILRAPRRVEREEERRGMNYFLFGGAPDTGKTEAITRLLAWLTTPGRLTVNHRQQQGENDFFACLEGVNAEENEPRVLISSTADNGKIIDDFRQYCDQHRPYNMVISAVRDGGDPMRDYFFTRMGICSEDCVREIPMAKITRRNTYDAAMHWYRDRVDELAHVLLGIAPFSIPWDDRTPDPGA